MTNKYAILYILNKKISDKMIQTIKNKYWGGGCLGVEQL